MKNSPKHPQRKKNAGSEIARDSFLELVGKPENL